MIADSRLHIPQTGVRDHATKSCRPGRALRGGVLGGGVLAGRALADRGGRWPTGR